APQLPERVLPRFREVAGAREHRVVTGRAVALAEDEPVAIGPVRLVRSIVEDPSEIQTDEHVDLGERAARMAGPGLNERVDDLDPKLFRKLFQRSDVGSGCGAGHTILLVTARPRKVYPPYQGACALRRACRRLPLPLEEGADEPVDVPVQHGVDVRRLVVGSDVLHHLVGRENVRTDLAPEVDPTPLAAKLLE